MNPITNNILLAAPVHRVFGAFADPAQLAQWFGPHGFTNTIHEFDFRPGGQWRTTMHGPDGTDYPNHSEFAEIEPNRRIVFNHLGAHAYRMEVIFEPLETEPAAQTRLTWHMFHETPLDEATSTFFHQANDENLERMRQVLEV